MSAYSNASQAVRQSKLRQERRAQAIRDRARGLAIGCVITLVAGVPLAAIVIAATEPAPRITLIPACGSQVSK